MSQHTSPRAPVDLAIVGAGIVGLGHAVEAVARGMSVTTIERDERPVGASVRNFGHGCVTGQAGEAYAYAQTARPIWLDLSTRAGFWSAECGTVVVARSSDEVDCLTELAEQRGSDEVITLTTAQVRARIPIGDGVMGGAFLPRDLRVDPRAAAPAIADWVARQPGAAVRWSTAVTGVEPGVVHTTRGDVVAREVIICVGHHVDRLLPEIAEQAGIHRCALQMLQVRPPDGTTIGPAVLTGTSLLRYPAFAGTGGAQALRERLTRERPDLLGADVNHMLTQLPNGDLIIGDTHTYATTLAPFGVESWDEMIMTETSALLGLPRLAVVSRWRGVYAHAVGSEFLRARVADHVTAVSVTSGIGMTTGLGLAVSVLDSLDHPFPATDGALPC